MPVPQPVLGRLSTNCPYLNFKRGSATFFLRPLPTQAEGLSLGTVSSSAEQTNKQQQKVSSGREKQQEGPRRAACLG